MGSLAKTRVIIADDHPVVLAGLVALLRQFDGLEIVAACSDGETALRMILELQPDLACLDIQMPGLTGTEIIKAAREAGSPAEFIFLTGSVTRDEFAAASTCGAIAIFHKDSASDEMLEWFEDYQTRSRGNFVNSKANDGVARSLTAREREIATLVARGLSNKHIAREANISEGTVKIHLYNIFQKLEIKNRTELANYANTRSMMSL